MPRIRNLHQFFWEQVASALYLGDRRISSKGWGVDRQFVLGGMLGGFSLEIGTYWEGSGQSAVPHTFASVEVHGLPSRLQIDAAQGFGTPPMKARVSCDGDRVRVVTAIAIPVQLGNLHLEQASVDLDEFLTPARQQAICSLASDLYWIGGRHQVRLQFADLPYPRKKKLLAAAMSGDPEGTRVTWECRDRVVALAHRAVSDAEVITRELRVEPDQYEDE